MSENPSNILIRQAVESDLDQAMDLIAGARLFMRWNGNSTQWADDYPSRNDILSDISDKHLYAIEKEQKILMIFALVPGVDPHYLNIEDGQWLDDREPYATVHRMASSGDIPRLADMAFDFCFTLYRNIRVDTHEDNAPMLKAITRNGFKRCGIVYMDDGSPRIAFQLIKQTYD